MRISHLRLRVKQKSPDSLNADMYSFCEFLYMSKGICIKRIYIVKDPSSIDDPFGDGFEGETVPFACELTPMRAFVRAVEKEGPGAAGALQSEPLDQDMLHRFRRMTGDGVCVVLDELTFVIEAIVSVSKMEHSGYSTQGNLFQSRSHQLRIKRPVSFSSQTLSLDWASSACALKRSRSVFLFSIDA